MSLLLGVCVASGQPFLGAKTSKGNVLYLDLESREYRVQERLDKILLGPAPDDLEISHNSDMIGDGLVEQLQLWLDDRENPKLIIIDTLGRVKGGKGSKNGGENAYESDTRIMGGLQKFAMKNQIAVLVVHHLKKSANEQDDFERISGSMGITGAADSVMMIKGKRSEKESILSVTSRDFEQQELVVTMKGGKWELVSNDSEEYARTSGFESCAVNRAITQIAMKTQRWDGTTAELLNEIMRQGPLPSEEANQKHVLECVDKYGAMFKERFGISVTHYRNSANRHKISIARGAEQTEAWPDEPKQVEPNGFIRITDDEHANNSFWIKR